MPDAKIAKSKWYHELKKLSILWYMAKKASSFSDSFSQSSAVYIFVLFIGIFPHNVFAVFHQWVQSIQFYNCDSL